VDRFSGNRTYRLHHGHRRRQYRQYFAAAAKRRLSLAGLPVYNRKWAEVSTLLLLQDASGFSVALGIVMKLEGDAMEVLTPLADPTAVAGLRFGRLKVERGTWREEPYRG
jgi:hypothetical protein